MIAAALPGAPGVLATHSLCGAEQSRAQCPGLPHLKHTLCCWPVPAVLDRTAAIKGTGWSDSNSGKVVQVTSSPTLPELWAARRQGGLRKLSAMISC